MKAIKISFLLLSFSVFAQSSWKLAPNIVPNNNGQRFDDVYFLDENTGWAANGYYASVFKTTDGGLTWTEQLNEANLPGNYYFRNIIFLNENIGFLGTLNNVFFKTTNGGQTWSEVTNITPNPNAICGLDVVGTSTIYGCGAYFEPAHIIKSTNSGNTWQYIDMSAYATALVEIKFTSETTGYVAGKSTTGAVILKTTDGGQTWTEIYNSNISGEYVWKLQILNSNPNTFFGAIYSTAPNPGKLISSSNAGITWNSFDAPESDVQAVGFINETTGWMGGHNTGFYQTNNGGQTWTNLNIGSNLNRIFVINESLAYASGTSIYKYTSETLNTESFNNDVAKNPLAILITKNPIENILEFTIDFKAPDNLLINIYDSNGKLLKKLQRDIITTKTKKVYNFNVSDLASGHYILEFHNNLGRISKHVIKL
ncbi:T9SS type A sorting domain-containing protein [Seonamhaeicola sp. NFXS20]|uniref:YCF48-related protein n=1 Tax=Seonamhaeicola sp. NFXS20 TaxID=2816959 RepID=UPI003B8AE0FF